MDIHLPSEDVPAEDVPVRTCCPRRGSPCQGRPRRGRTSSTGTYPLRTWCPHRDIMITQGHHDRTGDVPVKDILDEYVLGRDIMYTQGHHVLNGDVPVEDVLDRNVLGGDSMSAQGCTKRGRPWRRHLCPFLLLPLRTTIYIETEVWIQILRMQDFPNLPRTFMLKIIVRSLKWLFFLHWSYNEFYNLWPKPIKSDMFGKSPNEVGQLRTISCKHNDK